MKINILTFHHVVEPSAPPSHPHTITLLLRSRWGAAVPESPLAVARTVVRSTGSCGAVRCADCWLVTLLYRWSWLCSMRGPAVSAPRPAPSSALCCDHTELPSHPATLGHTLGTPCPLQASYKAFYNIILHYFHCSGQLWTLWMLWVCTSKEDFVIFKHPLSKHWTPLTIFWWNAQLFLGNGGCGGQRGKIVSAGQQHTRWAHIVKMTNIFCCDEINVIKLICCHNCLILPTTNHWSRLTLWLIFQNSNCFTL